MPMKFMIRWSLWINKVDYIISVPCRTSFLWGWGEPLMNYKNVLAAIEKITDSEALGMSPRRIILSTSGIPKLIRKMADDEVEIWPCSFPSQCSSRN